MLRSINKNSIWLGILFILLFFFLTLNSLVDDSPTMDEQNHIARGLAFLRTGDPRLSLEHPPLVNSLSALLLLTLPDIRLPFDDPSWDRPEGWYEFADLLLWTYNQDADRMVFLARLPIVFLTIGLALVGYHFAYQLWGRSSAMVAFFLFLFDPNILAHGRYSTTDIGGTTFLFLAILLLWRLWQIESWSWGRWVWTGIGLGLAFGSKLSTLVFVPILVIMAFLPIYPTLRTKSYWRLAGQRLFQFITAGLFSLFILWAIFGFEWRPFYFRSESLAILNSINGPMPTYWAGIEQIAGFTGGGRGSAFLLGQFSDEGFLAYFPVAFISKTPIPILFLLLGSMVILLKENRTRKKAIFLILPAILFFLLSMQSSLNIGYRHLIPVLPFILVLISGLASLELDELQTSEKLIKKKILLPMAYYTMIFAVLISVLLIHPHYISYFNLAMGGPENGYRILVDSNLDWGQDLLRLKHWMGRNEVREVNLAWFGSADPNYYDIGYRPLPGLGRAEFFQLWWDVPFNQSQPEPGIYAISVSNLWELPLRPEEKNVFIWFRDHEPDERVGYSILIYEIP